MVTIVENATWLDIDWNAVTAVSTIVLVIGGLIQLQLARTEARIARKPLLSTTRALIDPEGRIRVWFQNEGTGPATDVRLQFWLMAAEGYHRGSEVTTAGSHFWEALEDRTPQVTGILPAIGAGRNDVVYYVGRFPEIVESGGWALLGYRADARDIYGHRTDTVPLSTSIRRKIGLDHSRREPGWMTVIPEWDREFSGAPMSPLAPGTM